MNNLNRVKVTINKFANGKYILISLIMLFSFVFLLRGGKGYLDMRFGYSPDDVYKLIVNLDVEARRSYIKFLVFDFGIATFLSIMLSLIIAFLLKKLAMEEKWSLLCLLPLLRGIFDIMENIFIMVIFLNYPKIFNRIAEAGSIMTQLKWITMILSIVLIIVFTVMVLIKAFREKNNIM